MLWESYCPVRLSLVYRGRAVPLVWTVLEHPSRRVAYVVYKGLLDQVATLLPAPCRVVLTADRGFADTQLMQQLTGLGWHWRIRIKGRFWIYRQGKRLDKGNRIPFAPGQALFWQHVSITKQAYGPVHLALGRPIDSKDYGFVVSDEPTAAKTCVEYGRRCDIEENFLDDQSNGVQLESSLIRSAQALERLCGVLALTTVYWVAQGTAVVHQGKRRWVDAHWCRGQSYLKIGWNGVKLALSRGTNSSAAYIARRKPILPLPWLQKSSTRNNHSCSPRWRSVMPRDRLEFCQSISLPPSKRQAMPPN